MRQQRRMRNLLRPRGVPGCSPPHEVRATKACREISGLAVQSQTAQRKHGTRTGKQAGVKFVLQKRSRHKPAQQLERIQSEGEQPAEDYRPGASAAEELPSSWSSLTCGTYRPSAPVAGGGQGQKRHAGASRVRSTRQMRAGVIGRGQGWWTQGSKQI